MLHELYCVCDVKTGIFYPPMMFRNQGDAMRSLSDEMRKDGFMQRHPEDYDVYLVAKFFQSIGKVEPVEHNLPAFKMADLVKSEK